jgi:predicted DCC family thiol-disulfide oxidoreductase YuxK
MSEPTAALPKRAKPVPEPVYHPYTAWEDWQAGMWQTPVDVTADVERAVHILATPNLFRDAARVMFREWPNATEHNLTTNLASNRYSWVGQATCCHLANVPELATRAA